MRIAVLVCFIVGLLGAPVFAQGKDLTLDPGVKPHAGLDGIYLQFVEGYRTLKPELVSDLYTDDALYLAPGGEIDRGHARIAQIFRESFDKVRRDGAKLDLTFRIVQRRLAGDMAYDVGEYTYTRTVAGKAPVTARGKFVVVALKGKDRKWKFQVDGYSGINQK